MNTTFNPIIEFADQYDGFTIGVWIPHYGSAKVWSKRDCFVGIGCDTTEYHNTG